MQNPVGVNGIVPTPSRPLPSVRKLLLWMVLTCFLPGLVGSILLVVREYQRGYAQLQADTLQTARALVQAVDGEFERAQSMALTLSKSGFGSQKELEKFHQHAKELLLAEGDGRNVMLADANAQQVLNTARPFGAPLPSRRDLAQLHSVFVTRMPVISDLFAGGITGERRASVTVPLLLNDKVVYALSVSIDTRKFQDILQRQQLPQTWRASVFDRQGTIAQTSLDNEKFAGQKVNADLLSRLNGPPEASFQAVAKNGVPALIVYSRSAQSGWSVGIGIPREGLETQLKQSLLLLAAVASLLLCLSLGLAWFFGGRIAASLLALRASAVSLGNGIPVGVPHMHLRETQEVAQAIANAGVVLNERTRALSASHEVLVARESELEDAQRIAKVGSWSWNAHTDKTSASPEICRIFGIQEMPAFEQQEGIMFAHDAWLELLNARWVLGQTGAGYNLELPALRADGTPIWVNCRAEEWRGSDGKRIGLRGMIQDVTERRHQASELIALRAEMQTMTEWQVARHTVASLAHEINQPLASVSVLCEAARRMLLAEGLDQTAIQGRSARLEQTLQRLSSETERAGVVVRQLMKSVTQSDIALRPIVLGELLNNAAKMILNEEIFDCEIHIGCPKNLQPVRANQLQITKVLMNLISNAAQAMKTAHIAKGAIWINVTTVAKGSMVDISIRDEGPGIHARMQEEIFQPFVTTKSDGLGMGLTISRALVEAHQGKLWLEAHAGSGATFHFTLHTAS